jgi:hypothetical protein
VSPATQLARARVDILIVSTTEAFAYHLVLRLSDSRPIATTTAQRRVVARVVLQQGTRRGLLGFGLGPDHLHIEAAAPRRVVGELAKYVATALRARLQIRAAFGRAWIEPTRDQRHLRNRILYAMGQDRHHRGGLDPMFEATSLPDLLGLRVVDAEIEGRVRACVPKLLKTDILGLLPAGALDIKPPFGLDLLAHAAAAAFALEDLRGRSAETVLARHAAVLAASKAPSRELSHSLGISTRAVQRMRSRPSDLRSVHAVRGQLWLRNAIARVCNGQEAGLEDDLAGAIPPSASSWVAPLHSGNDHHAGIAR